MKIKADSFIKMHFKIRLKDGSIAEDTNTYDRPYIFQMGKGVFSERVEKELCGLQIGANRKMMLMPEDAFGDKNPAMIYEVPKKRFPSDMELEEGLIVAFSQKDGTELPGVITLIQENDVTVDFNHPLSGQVILFDVDILDVSDKDFG
ncbi:FKBP-type peptidyl-prolyl cis-trans isomerase [Fastidiosibacter lacustris]|uniref:FKBP-type peptidyl-prolyl cis-trans isomerase n=1 Tax=Fastidiosibacter lacustris TaxID=2056695 RepID=UPI000E3414E8|nr:FKBP-type peptidyl-prolyl cis-trans isomerase [Fastidiosibacter lacustris]